MILALEEAKYRLENFRANIEELGSALRIDELIEKVAIMGCVVNGPGEAKDADICIAGGIG